MSKKRYSKVEEEILEILDRAEKEPAPRRFRPSRPKLPRTLSATLGSLRRIPFGVAWLIGIFGLALAAILISDWSRTLASLLAIAAILVLFSPLVLGFRGASQRPGPKEWRGRVIDLPPRQDGLVGRLRYKLWEVRHRRR
jgi:hypothetical protein